MSSKEYREYSSSNVVRSLNPNRPLSPPQKHKEYNNNNLGRCQIQFRVCCKLIASILFIETFRFINVHSISLLPHLDEMLDDLKSTVNKTTEHFNTLNSSKNRDVQFLSPANSTHVAEERTSSPIVCLQFST